MLNRWPMAIQLFTLHTVTGFINAWRQFPCAQGACAIMFSTLNFELLRFC